jgi:hypothetical protein
LFPASGGRPLIEDGELVSSRSLAVGDDELPDEMIERPSEIVGEVPDDQAELDWEGSPYPHPELVAACLGIDIGDELPRLGWRVDERDEFLVERCGMRCRSLDLSYASN